MSDSNPEPKPNAQIAKVETIKMDITPFGLRHNSEDLHRAAQCSSEAKVSVIKYYLYCLSIELAMKAAILHFAKSGDYLNKFENKIKHNLDKLLNASEKEVPFQILNKSEKQALRKINAYYHNKGLEYWTSAIKNQMLKGYADIPDIEVIELVSANLQELLVEKGVGYEKISHESSM